MTHTFERWLQLAEARALSVTGLDLDSLGAESTFPCLRDAYDSGESPSRHADQVIAESGFPTEPDPPRRTDRPGPNESRYNRERRRGGAALHNGRPITDRTDTGQRRILY